MVMIEHTNPNNTTKAAEDREVMSRKGGGQQSIGITNKDRFVYHNHDVIIADAK
jgi:hypothetical protein